MQSTCTYLSKESYPCHYCSRQSLGLQRGQEGPLQEELSAQEQLVCLERTDDTHPPSCAE